LQITDAPAVRAPSDIATEPSGELSIRTPAKHLRRGIEVIMAMPKAAGDVDDPRIEPSPSPSP
jgi:hypothetical protein